MTSDTAEGLSTIASTLVILEESSFNFKVILVYLSQYILPNDIF